MTSPQPLSPCGRGQGEGPGKTEVIFRSILSHAFGPGATLRFAASCSTIRNLE